MDHGCASRRDRTSATGWESDPRWAGIKRDYTADQVVSLRGSLREQYTLARATSEKLWERPRGATTTFPRSGRLSGGQAVQMVKAGLKAIYLSGWQVAGDANLAEQVYPDQSLYPANSAPALVRRINNALRRADQIQWAEGNGDIDWFVPIVADGEAGFGGALNVFELTKSFIEAGAAGVHFEDQLAAEKKCGHMGGKVLVPTGQHIRTLLAARLAADVLDVPLLIVARTDANGANLLTSDIDPRDQEFCTGERTAEGFFRVKEGLDQAISRAIVLRPLRGSDLVRDGPPRSGGGRPVRRGDPRAVPRKDAGLQLLALLQLEEAPRRGHDRLLPEGTGSLGYKFQFITLAGFHSLNASMFELASGYASEGMPAYVELQEREFALESRATPPPVINGRSAPATSTRCPRFSAEAPLRPWP